MGLKESPKEDFYDTLKSELEIVSNSLRQLGEIDTEPKLAGKLSNSDVESGYEDEHQVAAKSAHRFSQRPSMRAIRRGS